MAKRRLTKSELVEGQDPTELVPLTVRFRRDHLAIIEAIAENWGIDRTQLIRMSTLRELGIGAKKARPPETDEEK